MIAPTDISRAQWLRERETKAGDDVLYLNIPWDDLCPGGGIYSIISDEIGNKELYRICRKNRNLTSKGCCFYIPSGELSKKNVAVKVLGEELTRVLSRIYANERVYLKNFTEWHMVIRDMYIYTAYYRANYTANDIAIVLSITKRAVEHRLQKISESLRNHPVQPALLQRQKVTRYVVPPEELYY